MYDDISVRIRLTSGGRITRDYWTATDVALVAAVIAIFALIWWYWNKRIRDIDTIEQFAMARDATGLQILFLDENAGEINDFLEGDDFMTYLQAIPRSQYETKMPGSHDMSSFKLGVRSMIASSGDITADEYKFLLRAVLGADQLAEQFCDAYDLPNMKAMMRLQPWTIIITRDDSGRRFEKGMPCTLGRYIFLPHAFIKQKEPLELEDTASEEQRLLSQTLIHEKLHLMQRSNQSDFDAYYRRIWGSFMSRREFPWRYRDQYFVNPDGLDINWTYGTFFPVLLSTGEGVKELYMDMSAPREEAMKTRAELLETVMTIPDASHIHGGMSIYHPNEFFAYAVIENIKRQTGRLLFVRDLDRLFAEILNKRI
jgi:hypothetical protein